MPRISALPSLTTVDGTDELAVNDVSASTTKKATKSDLLKDAATYMTNSTVTTPKIADDAVTAAKIDWAATGANGGIWWEELGRTTLASPTDTLSLGSLPARKYLKVMIYVIASGAIDTVLRFNSDAANNYSFSSSIFDGNAYGNSTNQAGILMEHNALANTNVGIYSLEIFPNVTGNIKMVMIDSMYTLTSAGAYPVPTKIWGQWVNTASAISTISIINGAAGDLGIGTEMVVLGHN